MTTPVTINTQQPQQFIVVTNPPQARDTVCQNFDGPRSRGLGITQIVVGIIIILTSVIGVVLSEEIIDDDELNIFAVGFGLWCPIFFLTSGSLGVVAAKQKTRKKLNALLGTSITSCLLSVAVFSWAAVIVPVFVNYSDADDDDEEGIRIGVITLGSIQLAAGLAEFITSVWLSKLCGDHICKPEKKPQTVQYITTTNSDGTVSQQVLMPHFQHQSRLPPVGSISANVASSATSHPDSTMVVQQGVTPPGAETYPKMQPHTDNQHTQAEYRPYPVQPQAVYGAPQPYPVQPQAVYGAAQPYPVQFQPAYDAAHPYPTSMQPGVHSTNLPPIETVRTVPPNVHADPPPSYDLAVGEQRQSAQNTDNLNNTAL